MLNNIYYILVEPQLGENIGAVARVISNFGFANLRIISPRDGWPNPKANELAAHGVSVIKNVVVYDNLSSAIADINFLIATTSQTRVMEKRVIDPFTCSQLIQETSIGNVGIMLGRERSGLTNEEITLADLICYIPTSATNPSLNIAQAACIIAYQLSSKPTKVINKQQNYAPKIEIQLFFSQLKEALDKNQFFKVKEKEEKMFQNIRNVFIKAQLTSQEVSTLRGIIKSFSRKD